MFCREVAAQVRGVNDRIEARGASVVFVGNGTPAMAAGFARDLDVRAPLYTDPSLEAYRAAGLPRTFGPVLPTLKHAARALRAGHRQGRTQGDPWQQGGVLVIGPGDRCHLRFSMEVAGTLPPLEAIVAAIPAAEGT